MFSQNTTCSGNLVEEQGDSFRCGDVNVTLANNKIYGPAWFGHQPWGPSSGFDLDGVTGLIGSGNSVYDAYSVSAWLIPLCGSIVLTARAQPEHSSLRSMPHSREITSTVDPRLTSMGVAGTSVARIPASADIQLGSTFYSTPENNIILTNETFVGTVVSVQNVTNWSLTGSLDGYASTYFPGRVRFRGRQITASRRA